jgi:Cft2 family RNA processing exonuclease
MQMKKAGIFLLFFGAAIIALGVSIKNKGIPEIKVEAMKPDQSIHDTDQDIGTQDHFIKAMSERFSHRYFTISKMEVDNARANADLMVEFAIRGSSGLFLLKTQWWHRYHNNKVEVATAQEILNYQSYIREFDEPMFKIIGIGGRSSAPKLLYIIPVEEIQKASFSLNELSKYKTADESSFFFFDLDEKRLK